MAKEEEEEEEEAKRRRRPCSARDRSDHFLRLQNRRQRCSNHLKESLDLLKSVAVTVKAVAGIVAQISSVPFCITRHPFSLSCDTSIISSPPFCFMLGSGHCRFTQSQT
ncbi:unnamed protein product [Arabidopsis halleri]